MFPNSRYTPHPHTPVLSPLDELDDGENVDNDDDEQSNIQQGAAIARDAFDCALQHVVLRDNVEEVKAVEVSTEDQAQDRHGDEYDVVTRRKGEF